MSENLPPTIDPAAAARWQRSAPAVSPWLHEEVARRMQERLDWIVKPPQQWLHWQPVRGGAQAHEALQQRFSAARSEVYECDPQMAAQAQAQWGTRWWQLTRRLAQLGQVGSSREAGDAPCDGAADMLWANMALHTQGNPQAVVGQWHKALAVDGYVMFSCLGPDTLRELHRVYAVMGWPPAGHAFTDMHDWGDMLVHAGFSEPVMDMERITLTFATPERLVQELRELGCNLHPQRFAGLRGKRWRERLYAALAQELASPAHDGQLAVTFEIVYGHAYKAAPKVRMEGRSEVSLDDMRTMLRGPRNTGLR